MNLSPSKFSLFPILGIHFLFLLGCNKNPIGPIYGSDLVVIIQEADATQTIRISQEELKALPNVTKQFKFEANGEEKKTRVVYFSDILDSLEETKNSNFWIVNCGDKYQSNFTSQFIESARP